MDAAVRLALMAKAKNVFESEDTYLSFPALSPLTKSKDWFHLALSHGMTDAELTAASWKAGSNPQGTTLTLGQ